MGITPFSLTPWQPRDIVDQLPRSQTETYKERPLAWVKYIVIHHAGVDADPSPEQTALYHVNDPNHLWPGIGYHGVIMKDGSGYLTQRLTTMSYNVAGLNDKCIGLLLNGDFNEGREPTDAQIITAKKFIPWIEAQLPTYVRAVGHKEIALASSPTNCPGDTFDNWAIELR